VGDVFDLRCSYEPASWNLAGKPKIGAWNKENRALEDHLGVSVNIS
jgi:hypothetical protein